MIHTDSRILASILHRDPVQVNKAIAKAILNQPSLGNYFEKYKGSYLVDIDHLDIANAILKRIKVDEKQTAESSGKDLVRWLDALCNN